MKAESKVGILFIASLVLIALFAYLLGFLDLFGQRHSLTLLYNFAGGVQEGSAVRAMGVRVGKVKDIRFAENYTTKDGEDIHLLVTIEVDKKVWTSIKEDSRFYVNLAGVIGERYIEITPGSRDAAALEPGAHVRGVDPPRIDQMLSQGFALAGKILEMVERNEPAITSTLATMESLAIHLNKLLGMLEKTTNQKEFKKISGNIEAITSDLLILTSRLRGEGAQETLDLLHELIFRLKDLDQKSIKKFLQDEGIRARIF